MATQRYILEAERDLEGMSPSRVRETIEANRYERRVNGGSLYDDNRQAWGSLWSNASALVEINPDLFPLVAELDYEFNPDWR